MNNNVKILIADDEERWRRLVGDFLRNEGFKTVEAANGQEAVELIRQDGDISLAILDIMMPVMDGIQACQTIRGFSQIPIIMLTAKSDEDSEVMGFVCGADEYISKPVKFPVFIARVKALLKRSVTLRSSYTFPRTRTSPCPGSSFSLPSGISTITATQEPLTPT